MSKGTLSSKTPGVSQGLRGVLPISENKTSARKGSMARSDDPTD